MPEPLMTSQSSTAAVARSQTLTARPTVKLPSLSSNQFTLTLDPDIFLACEDQARSQGIKLAEWLQQTANDALRGYLGI